MPPLKAHTMCVPYICVENFNGTYRSDFNKHRRSALHITEAPSFETGIYMLGRPEITTVQLLNHAICIGITLTAPVPLVWIK
jgi:hypothetical protein